MWDIIASVRAFIPLQHFTFCVSFLRKFYLLLFHTQFPLQKRGESKNVIKCHVGSFRTSFNGERKLRNLRRCSEDKNDLETVWAHHWKKEKKSFLFSCRCWFAFLYLYLSHVLGVLLLRCGFLCSHSRSRLPSSFPPSRNKGKVFVLSSSKFHLRFQRVVDVIMPYLICFDDIAGVWLLSPLRYHLWQQQNQA